MTYFGASSQPQVSVRGDIRGGRGNNSSVYQHTRGQEKHKLTELQSKPMGQPREMQVSGQKEHKFQPRNSALNDESQEIKITRNCKFGLSCRDFLNGNCKFNHTQRPSEVYLQDKSMQNEQPIKRNDSSHIQMTPSIHQKDMSQIKCKYGSNCYLAKDDRCSFLHDEDIDEEEVQHRKPISDYKRDNTYKQAPSKKQVSQIDEEDFYRVEKIRIQLRRQRQAQNQSKNYFSQQDMKALLEIENDREFIRSVSEIGGASFVENLSNAVFERDILEFIILFLEKLLKQNDSQICRQIIHLIIESKIFAKISEYIIINGMFIPSDDVLKEQNFLLASIWTLNQLMGMYQSQIDKFQTIINSIHAQSFLFTTNIQDNALKNELEAAVNLLMQRYKESIQTKLEEKKQKPITMREEKKARIDESYKNEPVQDFKLVNVVPGFLELEPLSYQELKKLRRRMPEEGDLMSSHNYLDIVFRLLHEDAISDLRNGISEVKQLQEKGAQIREIRKKLKENQVKIYSELTIQSLEAVDGSRCFQFRLPLHKKQIIDWRMTKKLIGGSLVILSHNGFESYVIGLIKNSDSRIRNKLQEENNYIPILVEILKQSDYETFDDFDFMIQYKGYTFDMIESSAYFESYRHVLVQLQEMDQWPELPMQQMLVHGHKDAIEQPMYMNDMMKTHAEEIKQIILRMNLDTSQKDALNHVINSNFGLIQGPPGTGKTYIGVQIVKLLVHFKNYWKKQGPILLVTYTNHALEQFLLLIKKITRQIVRIGGKQSNEELKKFGLYERLYEIQKGEQFQEALDRERESQMDIEYYKRQLLKFEFKCITSLINVESDEHKGIKDIMNHLEKKFMNHLNFKLKNLHLDIYTEDLIIKRIEALKKSTDQNILVLFWLGIIDLDIFIQFIIEDEKRRERINQLLSQIELQNNEFKTITVSVDNNYKEVKSNNKIIHELEINLEKQKDPTYKDKKKQKEKINETYFEEEEESEDYWDEEESWEEESKFERSPQIDQIKDKIKNLHQRNKELRQDNEELQNQQKQIRGKILFIEKQIQEIKKEAMHFGKKADQNREKDGNQYLLDKNDTIVMDQRQLDYEDSRLIVDGTVDALFNVIDDIINPLYMCEIFEGALSISDCILFMNQLTFQDQQEASDVLQSFLKSSENPFDEQIFCFDQRWQLNNFLMNEITNQTISKLKQAIIEYEQWYKIKKEQEALDCEKFLKKQDIIAMTTTGRAKQTQLLKGIEFPIVIVEEAAEVFEAHILTSLTKNTQHIILIGDHEQLKPNPSVYELDKQYNLSMSLFERLIKNGLNHSTLSIQRRMRPEISKIMNFIYKDLKDYPDVENYSNVTGLVSNVFFYNHKFQEEELSTITSKMNVEEAKMIVRFTQYILQQKQYGPNNITILTLYAGQQFKIKKLMQENPLYDEEMRFIKVANVDNYQGEENEIIILSLVRSNTFNNIGFLKISNRVCVALSRAKHGLYIFGNSSCLVSGKNPLQLWVQVINYLKQNNFIGDEIALKCEQHGNLASIKTVQDFEKVPEGGCNQQCPFRLECGHSCESICHPIKRTENDPTGHSNVECQKNCARKLLCGHECTYLCYKCKYGNQPCITKIMIEMPLCGHIQEVQCHKQKYAQCSSQCEKILKCGHICKKKCSQQCDDPDLPHCKEQIDKVLDCGHIITEDCGKNSDKFFCYKKCSTILPCGHKCKNTCGDCKKYGHSKCTVIQERNLICGHRSQEQCINKSLTCKEDKCKTKCTHGQCTKKCQLVCDLCIEPCQLGCEHSKCSKKCSEPCDIIQCNLPCQKSLPCEHPCISLCGLICPDICKICSPKDPNFNETFQKAEKDVLYVRLDDCGHLFDYQYLDEWMKPQKEIQLITFKGCPKCQTPIMSCSRYMSQINQTLNDINVIKGLILEQDKQLGAEFNRIREQMLSLQDKLQISHQLDQNFKDLTKTYKELIIHFNFSKGHRNTDLLNKVVVRLNFLNLLFALAKYIRESYMYSIDQTVVKNYFKTYCSQKEDLNKITIEQDYAVLKEFSKKYKSIQYVDEIAKIPSFSNAPWNKCMNGHYYQSRNSDQIPQGCPDCKN